MILDQVPCGNVKPRYSVEIGFLREVTSLLSASGLYELLASITGIFLWLPQLIPLYRQQH